jgi:hypothetical protein
MITTLSPSRFTGKSAALSSARLVVLSAGMMGCMVVVLLVGLELVKGVA